MSVVLTLLITPHLQQIIWGTKNDIGRTHLCICASNSAVMPRYKYKCVYNVQIKIMYNVQTQVILQGHANICIYAFLLQRQYKAWSILYCDYLQFLPRKHAGQLFLNQKQTLLLCFQTKVGISRWFDTWDTDIISVAKTSIYISMVRHLCYM